MLEIRNLSKSYGEKKAVCNLNLIVEDGDIMGFIGKNGAGKTTTLKSCLGIVGIDKGEILLDGVSILKEPIVCKKKISMAKKETTSYAAPLLPMLKTVEQMSKVSGIGENKLRELMDSGELEYIQNGNRRLIADAAIWDWYHRAKKAAKPPATQGG